MSPERSQELGALIAIRDELMEGDLRALYITWLAGMRMLGSYDEEEDDDIIRVPAVPPALGTLTAAQQVLAELWQVPQELLVAAVRHSSATQPSHTDDVVAWVEALPQARRTEYLVRLAKNEPGLSRRLVKELRALGQSTTSATPASGEQVTYAKLLAESKVIKATWEHEQREQEELDRQRRMRQIHEHQDEYWQRVELAVTRASGTGYDEAAGVLSNLREVADHFQEAQQFQARFRTWVRPHLRRPAFVKRLQERQFPLPEA